MEINQSSLSAAFTGFSLAYQNGFDLGDATYEQVATITTSASSQTLYPWLGRTTKFKEWFGERTLQNMEVHGYTIKNRDFEDTVTVGRNDIMDDTYGVYAPMFSMLGQDAKVHPDLLVYSLLASGTTALCYDGQPFFNANHPVESVAGGPLTMVSNYASGGGGAPWYLLDTSKIIKPLIFQKRKDYEFVALNSPTDPNVFMRKEFYYGVDARVNVGFGFWQYAYCSTQPLNAANFSAAKAAMRNFTGDNGIPLNVTPDLLLVPPSLETTARTLLFGQIIPNAQGTASGSNVLQGAAKLLVTPYVGA